MKILNHTISPVLGASFLGVIALVVSQLVWTRYVQRLSEEIFSQRVTMALCSTVENYEDGVLCPKICSASQNSSKVVVNNWVGLPHDFIQKTNFRQELDKSLRFHNINLRFELNLSYEKKCRTDKYQSAITLPNSNGQEAFLEIDFPEKDRYILGNMTFMLVTTMLILLFITGVLLTVNWSLLKQKRLLQTNIDFFNNMAHEFRTPLSNIGLAVNSLGRKQPDLKGNPFVAVIRRENAHLLNEVERILHLASIENGDYTLQKEPLPIRDLLQSAVNSLAMPIAECQATITLDSLPNLQINGDRQHLISVFRNLLENALKYTLGQPHIRISAQAEATGVLIAIQDNGVGIAKEHSMTIFDKFQRISNGDVQNQKGFGLGLAFVKSMVELHNGYVCVNSELNKGSRFDVFLPTIG